MNTLFFVALVSGDQASGYRAAIPDLAGLAAAVRLHADAPRAFLEFLARVMRPDGVAPDGGAATAPDSPGLIVL